MPYCIGLGPVYTQNFVLFVILHFIGANIGKYVAQEKNSPRIPRQRNAHRPPFGLPVC
jgi:hypothetical protein